MSALIKPKFNNKIVIKKQLKSHLLHFLLLPYYLMYFLAHIIEVIPTVVKETKRSMALVVYLLNSVISPNGRQ